MNIADISVRVDPHRMMIAKIVEYTPNDALGPAEILWDVFNPNTQEVAKDVCWKLSSQTRREVTTKLWNELKQLFHNNVVSANRSWTRFNVSDNT